jgi:uncharacterized protein (TIGR03437 family)
MRSLLLLFCGLAGIGTAQVPSLVQVSGNRQLVRTAGRTAAPLVVMARDAAGKPVSKTRIEWTIVSGNGYLVDAEPETDGEGKASAYFQGFSSLGAQNSQVTQITASLGLSSGTAAGVQFMATTAASPHMEVLSPASGEVLAGVTGTVGAEPVRVRVSGGSQPLPNVSLQLVPTSDYWYSPNQTPPPAISCERESATGDDGIAECRPAFSGTKGTAIYAIVAGGGLVLGELQFTVKEGPPAVLRLLGGNNQSAKPGARFSANFIARVEDAGGDFLPDVPVNIRVVPENLAVLAVPATGTATGVLKSESDGRVQVALRASDVSGRGQVKLSVGDGTATVAFDFTVTGSGSSTPPPTTPPAAFSRLDIVSGYNAVARAGKEFPRPLTVHAASESGSPVMGLTVFFSVVGGDSTVRLSSASVVTDASGMASVSVTAGNSPGYVFIEARAMTSSLPYTVSNVFYIHVLPVAPVISAVYSHPFYSAGNKDTGGIAPGGVATITGPYEYGMFTAVAPITGALPYSLAGFRIRFNGILAPLYVVMSGSNWQATVQVPMDLPPGEAEMKLDIGGEAPGEASMRVTVQPAAPALFETVYSDMRTGVVATRADGSYVSPENPARPGERITLYATGLGQTDPPARTNTLGAGEKVAAAIIAGVDGAGVSVASVRYAPGMIGVYAVEVDLPADVRSGSGLPVILAAQAGENQVFSNTSRLPVQ